MTLDNLFMPPLAKVPGKVVKPLGDWPEQQRPMTDEERLERRRASWREYADRKRGQRIAYLRDYRARRKAA